MTKVMGEIVTFAASQPHAGLPKLKQSPQKKSPQRSAHREQTFSTECDRSSTPHISHLHQIVQIMNFNFKTLSLGSLAAIALIAAPLTWVHTANAEGNGRGGHPLEQLTLTEAQSSQVEAIRTETRSQMEAVLTPEQRQTLAASDSPREGFRALDLSDDQRSEIRSLRESSREQINAILTDEQRQQLAELPGRGGRGDQGDRGQHLEALNLTEAQSTQIEAIRSDARSQMEAVLTAEQRATLGEGEANRRAWKSLDLTDEQREQMRAIHEASHEQINALLTEEQRQQLPERPQGRRGGSSDSPRTGS